MVDEYRGFARSFLCNRSEDLREQIDDAWDRIDHGELPK